MSPLLDSGPWMLRSTCPRSIPVCTAFSSPVVPQQPPFRFLKKCCRGRLHSAWQPSVVVPKRSYSDQKVERLQQWLRKMGHDKCNLNLTSSPRGSPAPGYGMVAGPGGVDEDGVIVKVPHVAFMTEQTALSCPHVGTLIERARMTPWQAMCLHLLCERACGGRSQWHPYIALLPTELELAGAHPMLWPQNQRKKWLSGSPMLIKTESRLGQCREDHKAMLAAGANQLMPAGTGSGGFVTEASVRWAAVILLSRAFSLDLDEKGAHTWSDTGPSIALVPWADMLNHSSKAGKKSCLTYDCRTRVAFLSAHKSYVEGEQVYDSYGPNLSASQLLVDFGFVDEENENHSIDLPAAILGPLRGRANAALLDAVGLPLGGAMFSLTQSGVHKSVLAWTRVAVASLKELADVGWKEGAYSTAWVYTRASSAMAQFYQPVSRENESEVLRRLLLACERLLNQYPSTLEDDATKLALSDGVGGKVMLLPWARKQALRACYSEKLALQGAWKMIWGTLKRLRSGVPLSMLYL